MSAADPKSVKRRPAAPKAGGAGRRGPVPADNQPGHHPDHEQDKPIEAFVARAEAKVRESHEAHETHEAHGADRPADGTDRVAADRAGVSPDAGRADAPPGTGRAAASPGADAQASAPRRQAASGPPSLGVPATAGTTPGWRPPRLRVAGLPAEVVAPPLAILDAAVRPGPVWEEIGESRTEWLARITLLPFVGSWRYATAIRPRLDAAEAAAVLRGA